MENNSNWLEFNRFLSEQLAIPSEDLAVVLNQRKRSSDPVPMLLWQYGLISLEQLRAIFDWLDDRITFPFAGANFSEFTGQ